MRSRRAGREAHCPPPSAAGRDDDARGPQDVLAEPPARLDHGQHRALGDLGGRLGDQRLVLARVEDPPSGAISARPSRASTSRRALAVSATPRRSDSSTPALRELVERALEIVEHGQERTQDARAGLRRLLLGEPRLALLVVVEVGRQPSQVIEVRVALELELRDPVQLGLGGRIGAGRGRRRGAGARDCGLVGGLGIGLSWVTTARGRPRPRSRRPR